MSSFIKSIGLAAIVSGLCAASFAQDAAAPSAPPTLETAKVGEVYLAETVAPWELRCTKIEAGEGPCQIFQLLKDDTGGDVAEFNMFQIPDGNEAVAGAVIVVPLETALEAGLVLQVDDNPARAYPFAFCNSYGCFSRPGFNEEELGWMKAGSIATITIVPVLTPEEKVTLTLSLDGFSDMIVKTQPKS